jgi:two-component system OmpR family response regulator
MKVCIIDDNVSITGMVSKLLKMKGHESVVVNDGRQGLETLEKEIFDVVILDIAMPEFSGVDIIDALNKSGRIKEQKICILSASSTGDKTFDYLVKNGAKEALKKPLNLDSLISTLERIANSN